MSKMKYVCLLPLLACASYAGAGDVVWLEAERFDNLGGWVNDAQFLDLMGSPCLLAAGMGTPVADATTRTTLPAGTYRLWVRSKDWFPSHHPGRFQVLLNGKTAGATFGQSGRAGWLWEDGGSLELSGEVTVSLHDLTGYYGRCDAVVLSRSAAWRPQDEPRALAGLRHQYGGLSPNVREMPASDVVVIGGGLAGCTAAVAAARNGAVVTLLQNRPILGGNASTEILVPPVGVWPHMKRSPLDPRETGLVEEFRTTGNQQVSEGKLYTQRLTRWVRAEPDIRLHLNTHATAAEMDKSSPRRIAGVLAVDVTTGRRMRFPARLVIDCSGDSVVALSAGAEFRQGKESKAQHNEPWAPDQPSSETMGNSLKYFHQDAGSPQPFEAPDWIFRFDDCGDFAPGRHPPLVRDVGYQWMLELGGKRDTFADAEEIRDDILRLIFGLWDHAKNRCPTLKDRLVNHRLVWVGHVAGKRENRRLIGDCILTQNDIVKQTLFPDRVAYGGWVVDDHHSAGFFHKGTFGRHQDDRSQAAFGTQFAIPFGCLYSRNVDNLMMAGRNISATHLAMADTRVMMTTALMGHAAGTAAGLCKQFQVLPRELAQKHMALLQQQLLKEGAYLIDLPAEDPRDLARRAKASASSEGRDGEQVLSAGNVTDGYGRAEGTRLHAWAPASDATGPHWVQLAWERCVAFNVVHVNFQTAARAPREFAVEAWQDGAWKTLTRVSDNRHRRHVLAVADANARVESDRLRVVTPRPAAVCEIRVYLEPPDAVQTARRAHEVMRQRDAGPFLPWEIPVATARPVPPQPLDPGKRVEGAISLEQAAGRFGGTFLDDAQGVAAGHWAQSTWGKTYIGEGYAHDANADKAGKSLRFDLDMIKPGRYELRLAYSAFTNRASNVAVTITTPDGPKTVRIDQRKPPRIDGLLQPLGTFELDAKSRVTITAAGTDGYVVVDALQIVPGSP